MRVPERAHIEVLLALAQRGIDREMKISTPKLAAQIGMSQQSASRILKEMEKEGMVSRQVTSSGQTIRFSRKGKEALLRRYHALASIFGRKTIAFKGTLISGLGRGKYFIGLKGYRKQFIDKLGINPFPGTLNLKIDKKTGNAVRELNSVIIEGFSIGKKTFGGLKCCNAKVIKERGASREYVPAAIVIPYRTVHEQDTVEIISDHCLRERLSLKDGDEVRVVV